MSATAEELAAQSEQLQANIAFFRLADGRDAAGAPAGRSARAPTPLAPAKRQPPARLESASPRASAVAVVRKAQAAPGPSKGFALALSDGGKDEHDNDFERY
jgi:methyl-accepting chemotaxis protein